MDVTFAGPSICLFALQHGATPLNLMRLNGNLDRHVLSHATLTRSLVTVTVPVAAGAAAGCVPVPGPAGFPAHVPGPGPAPGGVGGRRIL